MLFSSFWADQSQRDVALGQVLGLVLNKSGLEVARLSSEQPGTLHFHTAQKSKSVRGCCRRNGEVGAAAGGASQSFACEIHVVSLASEWCCLFLGKTSAGGTTEAAWKRFPSFFSPAV